MSAADNMKTVFPLAGVEVRLGQIVVNSATLLNDTDDLKVYSFDLASKYPVVFDAMGTNGGNVGLCADENTLGISPDPQRQNLPTLINFPNFSNSEWDIIAEGSSYTVRVIFIKRVEETAHGVVEGLVE